MIAAVQKQRLVTAGLLIFFIFYAFADLTTYIGLLLMTAGGILVLKKEGIQVFNTPLTRPFGLLIVFALFSFLYVENYRYAGNMFGNLLEIALPFFICARFFQKRGEDEHRLFVYAFFAGALLIGVYAIYQMHFLSPRWITSFLNNPNILGLYSLFVFSIALALIYMPRPADRIPAVLVLAASGLTLVYTQSRAALFGAFFSVLCFGLLRDKRLLILLLVLVGIAPYLLPQSVIEDFSDLAEVFEGQVFSRYYIWRNAWDMFASSPLWGQGIGQYRTHYRVYEDATRRMRRTHHHAHNIFLQIGSELGLIGLLLVFWIMISLSRHIYSRIGHLAGYKYHLALGLTAALTGFLFQELFEFSLINAGGITILTGVLSGWLVGILPESPKQVQKNHI